MSAMRKASNCAGSTPQILRGVSGGGRSKLPDSVPSEKSPSGSRNCTILSIGGRSSGMSETHLHAISTAVASSSCGAVSFRYSSTASSCRPFSRKLRTWKQEKNVKLKLSQISAIIRCGSNKLRNSNGHPSARVTERSPSQPG